MPVTAPEGRSFKQRWPDDAATADWLGGSAVKFALGGLAGVVGLPALCGMAIVASPILLVVLAMTAIVAVPLGRRRGRTGGIGRVLFRLSLFLAIVGLAGATLALAAAGLLGLLCGGDACPVGTAWRTMDLRVAVVSAASMLGSFGIGIGAAFAVSRIAARYVSPPMVLDPKYEAWRERRRTGKDGEG